MSKLRKFQKLLKANPTDAEQLLWHHLRNRRFAGYKFRRQHLIASYIVDFVCTEKFLIIELDGSQHLNQKAYDDKRTFALSQKGFRVLRFWNDEWLMHQEETLEVIYQALNN